MTKERKKMLEEIVKGIIIDVTDRTDFYFLYND